VLVFKAHSLSYHATLVSRVMKKKDMTLLFVRKRYRGTSLIRNSASLGPYRRKKKTCSSYDRGSCGVGGYSTRAATPAIAHSSLLSLQVLEGP